MSNSFCYTPKVEDMLAAFKLHYPMFPLKRVAIFLLFAACMGFAASQLPGKSGIEETLKVIGGVVLVSGLIYVIIQIFVRFWWMPRYTRRIYRQQADLRSPVTIAWDDSHFSVHSADSQSRILWSDIYRWNRNDAVMMLYRSEALFNFFSLDDPERITAAETMQSFLSAAGVKQQK